MVQSRRGKGKTRTDAGLSLRRPGAGHGREADSFGYLR
jgi:hypothetical protein